MSAALLALAALVGAGAFTPSQDVAAVREPTSRDVVAQLTAGTAYPLLKTGGPDKAWCKLELGAKTGWVPCSAGTSGDTPKPPADARKADARKADARKADAPKAPADAPFDYYLLALSWSPTFCAAKGAASPEQCGPTHHFGFVVHGLWPQHEKGYPQDCGGERLDPAATRAMLDLMPSTKLIEHEWSKHGTCTGLPPAGYFAAIRAAHAAVRIPPELAQPDAAVPSRLADIEAAFIRANPGLTPAAIAVQCQRTVSEIRICLDKSLRFRACGADVRDRCTGNVVFPPVP